MATALATVTKVSTIASNALNSVKTAADLMGKIKANVGVAIQIENWTKFPLLNPEVRLYKGNIVTPPGQIAPGSRDAIALEKGGGCNGTFGTISWLISMGSESASRRVVVMWYMPFNFNHHVNKLAVGITKPGVKSVHQDGNAWYYYMAEDAKKDVRHRFQYERRDFYWAVRTAEVSDELFEVQGTCGNTHVCEAKITILPKRNKDVAPNVLS